MKRLILIIAIPLVFIQSNCKSSKAIANDKSKTIDTPPISIEVADSKKFIINKRGDQIELIEKSEEEWKKILSSEEFYVLREKGTERAFSGDLWENKKPGLYTCAACDLVLFTSSSKYDSGTGWPSFFRADDDKMIKKDTDHHLGYARTEVMCARCGGHLGHVFDDGPPPTGLRYCINSVSLDFIEAKN